MKNKSSIMFFSAMQILIFHLWITVWQGNTVELFIQKTTYVGVDIFFFLSAYSLGKRELTSCAQFLQNRFMNVYLKFLAFSVAGFFWLKWEVRYFLQVISGIDLLRSGGGAFLWFLPAIMLFYMLFCIFKKCEKRNEKISLGVMVLIWAIVSLAVTELGFDQCAIVLNRVPVFMIGYYASKYGMIEKMSIRTQIVLGSILFSIGCFLTYRWGFIYRIQNPFVDSFYLIVIPMALGTVLLVGLIPAGRIMKLLGSATLEMYAVQMLFGYSFAGWMIKHMKNRLLINCCTFLFVIVCAQILHFLTHDVVLRMILQKKEKKK